MSRTHACPIGLVPPCAGAALAVPGGWCFDHWESRIRALPPNLPETAWPPPGWTLHDDPAYDIAYAPFDWTNTQARVALVGITPGRHQGWAASMEAARALTHGACAEEALRRAQSTAGFSGRMRLTLVSMLDEIGLPALLGIETSADLFGDGAMLATHLSALAFPVFVDGLNYTGTRILQEPVFVALIEQVLAAQLDQAPHALVIPLGRAAGEAVGFLVERGALDPARCLFGFPHPSGANGHRQKQFDAGRAQMADTLLGWNGKQAA